LASSLLHVVVFQLQEKSNSLDSPKMPYFENLIVLGQQATPNVWPDK